MEFPESQPVTETKEIVEDIKEELGVKFHEFRTSVNKSIVIDNIIMLLCKLEQLDMTVGNIRDTKIGKILTKYEKEFPEPIKSHINRINGKWREILQEYREAIKQKMLEKNMKQMKKSQQLSTKSTAVKVTEVISLENNKVAVQSNVATSDTAPFCDDGESMQNPFNALKDIYQNFLGDLRQSMLTTSEKLTNMEVQILSVKQNLFNVNQKIDLFEKMTDSHLEKINKQYKYESQKGIANNLEKQQLKKVTEEQGNQKNDSKETTKQPIKKQEDIVVLYDRKSPNPSYNDVNKTSPQENVTPQKNKALAHVLGNMILPLTSTDKPRVVPSHEKSNDKPKVVPSHEKSNDKPKVVPSHEKSNEKEFPISTTKMKSSINNISLNTVKSVIKGRSKNSVTNPPCSKKAKLSASENDGNIFSILLEDEPTFESIEKQNVNSDEENRLTFSQAESKMSSLNKKHQENTRSSILISIQPQNVIKTSFLAKRKEHTNYGATSTTGLKNECLPNNVSHEKDSNYSFDDDSHLFKKPADIVMPTLPDKSSLENGVLIKGERVTCDALTSEDMKDINQIPLEEFMSFTQAVHSVSDEINKEEVDFLMSNKKKTRVSWNNICKNKEGVKYAPLMKTNGRYKAAHKTSVSKEAIQNLLYKKSKQNCSQSKFLTQ